MLAIATLPFAIACEGNNQTPAPSTEHSTPAAPRSGFDVKQSQTLPKADHLNREELRHYLANKKLSPPGLVGGFEIFEKDGVWRAFLETTIATSLEGSWDIRIGSKGSPELCTTEAKINGHELPQPRIICREILVSRAENKAMLTDSRIPSRKYLAAIVAITR